MNNVESFSRLYDALEPDTQEALMWALSLVAKLRKSDAPAPEDTAAPLDGIREEEEQKRAEWLANIRADIKRHIWEPDLKSEILDRALMLVDAGVVTMKELETAVKRSERTPPTEKSGKTRRWAGFARTVKRWYSRTSEKWTPCAEIFEPRD